MILARRAWKSSKFEHEEISLYSLYDGNHTSISYVLAAENPISPVHNSITRYGNPNNCNTFSAFAVNYLITSKLRIYGRNTSGITILPSTC